MKKVKTVILIPLILILIAVILLVSSCSGNEKAGAKDISSDNTEDTAGKTEIENKSQVSKNDDIKEGAATSNGSLQDNETPGFSVIEISAPDGVNSYIVLVYDDGSGIKKLTGRYSKNFSPVLSPDASLVAFYSNNDGDYDIYIMNTDGTGLTNLTDNDTAGDYMPVWSPDGKKICYYSDESGNSDIYTINIDGSGKHNITASQGEDYSPVWSPDGKTIYYVSSSGTTFDIYSISPDGTGGKKITSDDFFEQNLSFSTDGKTILYAGGEIDSTVFDIFLLDLNTLNVKKITDNMSYSRMPIWAREDKTIVFNSDMDGLSDIYLINSDGSGLINLTDNSVEDYLAGISSDGKKIIYQSYEDKESQAGTVYMYDLEKSAKTMIADDRLTAKAERDFDKLRETESNPGKIFGFIDDNIADADTGFADAMVDFAIEFSENELELFSDSYYESEIQQKLWSDFGGTTDLEILKESTDKEISELAAQTLNRKYKLISSEGYIWPVVDYSAYKQYYGYLSNQMKGYIDIMAQESDTPSVSDAGLTISLDEYVERIISLYDFESKYPGFARIYYIINMLNGKLWVYMAGIDNTPVFDFNGKILPERLEDFKKNSTRFAGTGFGGKIDEYLDLLKSQGYKRTDVISDYLENLFFE